MNLEIVKELLSDYGLSIVSVIVESDNSGLYMCRNQSGNEIKVGIKDGQVVFPPG